MKHARRRHGTRTGTIRKRRHNWTMAVAFAAAVAAVTVTAAPSLEQQEAQPRQKKYRATRPIAIDQQTGAVRMPTDAEVEELVTTLSTLTKRTAEGLAEAGGAAGAIVVDLDGGFAGVMLARANADGTFETRCVFTFEEGAEFLGLVEAQ
jgi:hypothetical protein